MGVITLPSRFAAILCIGVDSVRERKVVEDPFGNRAVAL